MKNAYIGIDIGGTNVKIGLFDSQITLLSKTSVPTEADMGPADVVERIAKAALDLLDQAGLDTEQIQAIGIGVPGPADYPNGIVIRSPNMPKFKNIPLREMVSAQLGNRPAVLENDANVACWGEFAMGAGKEIEDMVFFTLGTGIGDISFSIPMDNCVVAVKKGASRPMHPRIVRRPVPMKHYKKAGNHHFVSRSQKMAKLLQKMFLNTPQTGTRSPLTSSKGRPRRWRYCVLICCIRRNRLGLFFPAG